MNLTHAMMWNEEAKMFQCRWGSCCFEVTWNQMKNASYHPTKEHVKFISEEDFDGGGGNVEGLEQAEIQASSGE